MYTINQWLAGPDLLAKPVLTKGATSIRVYFPRAPEGEEGARLWYDVETYAVVRGEGAYLRVKAPLAKMPVFQRGGSIIPRCVVGEYTLA